MTLIELIALSCLTPVVSGMAWLLITIRSRRKIAREDDVLRRRYDRADRDDRP